MLPRRFTFSGFISSNFGHLKRQPIDDGVTRSEILFSWCVLEVAQVGSRGGEARPRARPNDEEAGGSSSTQPFRHGCDAFDSIYFGSIQIITDHARGVHCNW
jgi:hypothetical protein